jgi:hypothetical protein
VIEAVPIFQLMGRDTNHNDYNGYKVFVDFVPNKKDDYGSLPLPCTTKVSLYENDPVYNAFTLKFKDVFEQVQGDNSKKNAKKPMPPAPATVPAVPGAAAPGAAAPGAAAPAPSVTSVRPFIRQVGCSRQVYCDTIKRLKDAINSIDLEELRNSATTIIEPGLAQKNKMLNEIIGDISSMKS